MNMMFDRVCAKKIAKNNTTQSGISLQSDDESLLCAVVTSVGKGTFDNGTFIPMQIKVGDKIFYEKHTAIEFCDKGEEYVILRQIDVVGIEGENDEKDC